MVGASLPEWIPWKELQPNKQTNYIFATHVTCPSLAGRDDIAMRILLSYFLLTFLVSWIFFLGVVLLSNGPWSDTPGITLLQPIMVLLGVVAPSLVALLLLHRNGAKEQIQKILKKVVQWKVGIRWYLFADGYIVFIKLLVAGLHKMLTGVWPVFGPEPWYLMAGAVFISTWVQAGEEIGWRGFALPRLTEKFGLPLTTLILGLIWAAWHLPLFFVPGASTYGQSFLLYTLQVTALSVALGWLYWQSGGSLLLTMLMHAAVNNTKDIVPSAVNETIKPYFLNASLVGWLTVLLLWIFASIFLIHMRKVKALG